MLAQGRGEFAGAGSPISPPSDHFLLNSEEEGAWPKTSPRCWGVAGSLGAVEIQISKKPFGDRRKCPVLGDFSSSRCLSYRREGLSSGLMLVCDSGMGKGNRKVRSGCARGWGWSRASRGAHLA